MPSLPAVTAIRSRATRTASRRRCVKNRTSTIPTPMTISGMFADSDRTRQIVPSPTHGRTVARIDWSNGHATWLSISTVIAANATSPRTARTSQAIEMPIHPVSSGPPPDRDRDHPSRRPPPRPWWPEGAPRAGSPETTSRRSWRHGRGRPVWNSIDREAPALQAQVNSATSRRAIARQLGVGKRHLPDLGRDTACRNGRARRRRSSRPACRFRSPTCRSWATPEQGKAVLLVISKVVKIEAGTGRQLDVIGDLDAGCRPVEDSHGLGQLAIRACRDAQGENTKDQHGHRAHGRQSQRTIPFRAMRRHRQRLRGCPPTLAATGTVRGRRPSEPLELVRDER